MVERDNHTVTGYRTLSVNERYAVTCDQLGFANILSMSCTIPVPASVLITQLSKRIEHLVDWVALFRCKLTNSSTEWVAMNPSPTVSDLLFLQSLPQDSEQQRGDPHLYVKQRETEILTNSIKLDQNHPFWRVAVYSISKDKSIVSVSAHHVIMDGMALLNVMHTLVRTDFDLSLQGKQNLISSLTGSISSLEIPPKSNDTIPMSPSVQFLLVTVFRQLILPRLPLPKWIASFFQPDVCWPNVSSSSSSSPSLKPEFNPLETNLVLRPSTCPPEYILLPIHLPNLLPRLTLISKKHGIPTLHSLFITCCMVSLYSCVSSQHPSLTISTESPISTRIPSIHGLLSGNYISSQLYSVQLDPTLSFWSIVSQYYQSLISPNSKKIAAMQFGILNFLSQPSLVSLLDSNIKTSSQPYSISFGCSNLTKFPETQSSVERVSWWQTPMAHGSAISIGLIAIGTDRIKFSFAVRKGALPNGLVQNMVSSLDRLIRLLACQTEQQQQQDDSIQHWVDRIQSDSSIE